MCEGNSCEDTKVSQEGQGGGTSVARAEIARAHGEDCSGKNIHTAACGGYPTQADLPWMKLQPMERSPHNCRCLAGAAAPQGSMLEQSVFEGLYPMETYVLERLYPMARTGITVGMSVQQRRAVTD